ncbi:GNAT family N-acetyltransferase [Virgibacillus kekensis]|uniref:GNAT family N-acetyltransferase n=1 Tax=Virgibacillus kekensis TaxID=202261 RepID=A0ABV9DKZ5_9BACI
MTNSIKIRKATQQDAQQIAKVHVDSWRTTYRGIVPDSLLDSMSYDKREKKWKRKIPEDILFIAEKNDGMVVGFASGGNERQQLYTGYDSEVYAIYILNEYQKRGIGRRLIRAVAQELSKQGFKALLIWVLEDNDSKHFYEAIGGQQLGHAQLEIGGELFTETAYGWTDIRELLK